jgi:hypothetical protein
LPRRYRPPGRRRKSKKERLQQETAAPRDAGAAPPLLSPLPVAAPVAVKQERPDHSRHIARDHTYVLGDLRRVALMAAFIIGGLVITAILR